MNVKMVVIFEEKGECCYFKRLYRKDTFALNSIYIDVWFVLLYQTAHIVLCSFYVCGVFV